jgi:hypothetical protein
MSLLIIAIVIVIVACLLIWAVDQAGVPSPINNVLKVAIIVIAALLIAHDAGLV